MMGRTGDDIDDDGSHVKFVCTKSNKMMKNYATPHIHFHLFCEKFLPFFKIEKISIYLFIVVPFQTLLPSSSFLFMIVYWIAS
jgi:hypothetical protein